MPLPAESDKHIHSGVNKKCAQCTKSCKQFKQMVVVKCSKFVAIGRSMGGQIGEK